MYSGHGPNMCVCGMRVLLLSLQMKNQHTGNLNFSGNAISRMSLQICS